MNSVSPIFLIVVTLFAVAFVTIVVLASKQQKAAIEKFWARLIPVVNGQAQGNNLHGRYGEYAAEANVSVNSSEDGDTTYRYRLILTPVVGKSS